MRPSTLLTRVPSELQLQIFSHLGWESHISCARVCTLWRDLIQRYGHTFPCKDWAPSYSDATFPGIHTVLYSHELQLIIYNEELVSVSIHKIVGTDYSRFGPIGDLVCTVNPRRDYLLRLPLFRFSQRPDENPETDTLTGFCYGVETANNWESAIERFKQSPDSSRITIEKLLGRLVAVSLRQSESRKWKLIKMRARYMMVTGGHLAVFWCKFIRGVGERETTTLDD